MQIKCKASFFDIGLRKLEFKLNFLLYQLINGTNSNKISTVVRHYLDIYNATKFDMYQKYE